MQAAGGRWRGVWLGEARLRSASAGAVARAGGLGSERRRASERRARRRAAPPGPSKGSFPGRCDRQGAKPGCAVEASSSVASQSDKPMAMAVDAPTGRLVAQRLTMLLASCRMASG